MLLTGESRRNLSETSPTAIRSTKNPTWTDAGGNPGLRCERAATNRLSYGTGQICIDEVNTDIS
jgi:hypothetical protein